MRRTRWIQAMRTVSWHTLKKSVAWEKTKPLNMVQNQVFGQLGFIDENDEHHLIACKLKMVSSIGKASNTLNRCL